MSISACLLLGNEGSFSCLGTGVTFMNSELQVYDFSEAANHVPERFGGLLRSVGNLANKLLGNRLLHQVILGYVHTSVHELSHASAYRLCTGTPTTIEVYTHGLGSTDTPLIDSLPHWKQSVINVAGPMGDVAFSSCQLIASTALSQYLPWPISVGLGGNAVLWITGELVYAGASAIAEDNGDFGEIRRLGTTHLVVASAALVSQVAFGIFAAIGLRS